MTTVAVSRHTWLREHVFLALNSRSLLTLLLAIASGAIASGYIPAGKGKSRGRNKNSDVKVGVVTVSVWVEYI